ncbi:hypothetical protein JCM11491_002985 [Sporobolomyces phaffii]
MSTSSRTISVVGATGNQGGGVVDILLRSTDYLVRALSSNPSSDKAKALLSHHSEYVAAGRFEIVPGNLDDRASLETALKGSYGLFAAFPGVPVEGPLEENPEVVQGKNLVDAAKAVGIEHFVYSTLPSIAKITNDETRLELFEAKALVEEYARAQLETKSTFVIPGFFFTNLELPLWANRSEDGEYVITSPSDPETPIGWVDSHADIGKFVTAIFERGLSVTAGKTYPINSCPIPTTELAQIYHRVTGESIGIEPTPWPVIEQAIASLGGPVLARELIGMLKYVDSVKPTVYSYGHGYIEDDTSFEDLGVKASTFEEYLERSKWKAPRSASAPLE